MSAAEFEELASRAERGELRSKPGTARSGTAAAREAQRMLMEATGASSAEEVMALALGRPPAGQERGESPTVRGRVPRELKDAVREFTRTEDITESELVRVAVTEFLVARGQRLDHTAAAR